MKVIRIITRADAIRLGLKRYMTGKPCKRGHFAERRTKQGDCTTCNQKRTEDVTEWIAAL
ncbi:hypothetical protein XbrCFBP1976_13735 [Xanthomonas bromi]|uniref:Uncharacterized protein n=1 Tax=Xanthomonas bromi TaxID=56449 RepID=A0ABX5BNM2_9XANT|nr:hypothetical protein XbrCFBP1976_13735 [Xanthomonas bromi]